MPDHLVFLSIPGLREQDLAHMPKLRSLVADGDAATLIPNFPCVTWPIQANMLTGKLPTRHGVVGNGFYWRERNEVEMWTAGNDVIRSAQVWDILHQHDLELTSAVWFPMLSKGCGADYVCMPAPVHNPDGSETLWCYTKPAELYGDLQEELGDFPLKHFWGPLAGIESSTWIAESAASVAEDYRPKFFYIYLPHLDYAAQQTGPDSPPAMKALKELDLVLGRMFNEFNDAWPGADVTWMIASEYTIEPVDHVTYPNRVLREAGLLAVREEEDGEHLDLAASRAWALVDHQFSHVFIKDAAADVADEVMRLFDGQEGIAEVLAGVERLRYEISHYRSGEVILISTTNSWQAYYWWLDDAKAPGFARTVDIHRKPGYDPVELHFDPKTKSIPLDATLVKGSHGAPDVGEEQCGVLLSSKKGTLRREQYEDVDVAKLILGQFGIRA